MTDSTKNPSERANADGSPELNISIRPLQVGEDASAFRRLNEEWITQYFTLEAKDQAILGNPEEHILCRGGRVFMLYAGSEAVGCVALVQTEAGVYELSKMAIAPGMRGLGLGRKLLEYTISQAKAIGATSLFLGSNTKLQNAVHLYESVGFRHVEPERVPNLEYARANVFMELHLTEKPATSASGLPLLTQC